MPEFDVGVFDALAASQVAEIAIDFDQPVVGAAGNPQQMDLLIGFGIQRGEFLVELSVKPPELNAPTQENLSTY